MSNQKEKPTVSSVRTQFSTFFGRVMALYNLVFFKEEKDHKAEDMNRFAIELYEAGRISDYIKETIDDTVTKFAQLLPGQAKKRGIDLEYLDAYISLNISDINAEIGELIVSGKLP